MLANLTVAQASELPADLGPFVQASLSEGFLFLQRLRGEWNSGANRFMEPFTWVVIKQGKEWKLRAAHNTNKR